MNTRSHYERSQQHANIESLHNVGLSRSGKRLVRCVSCNEINTNYASLLVRLITVSHTLQQIASQPHCAAQPPAIKKHAATVVVSRTTSTWKASPPRHSLTPTPPSRPCPRSPACCSARRSIQFSQLFVPICCTNYSEATRRQVRRGSVQCASVVAHVLLFIVTHALGRPPAESIKLPPPLPKHNMTLAELKKYDGKGEDGRVCVAILGKVYDVTKGKKCAFPQLRYRNSG